VNRSDQELLLAARASFSMREVMERLGYSISGQTAKMLSKRLEELGVSPPSGGSHKRKKQDLSKILVENSTYSSSNSLKRRLISNNLIEYKCHNQNCDVVDTWNGKPIQLQLEHKNGNPKDNRLENLELLCPNCHTQTPTWGRKDRARPR
jgi:hypothetical protein